MNTRNHEPIDEATLHALVDGRLSPAETARLEATLQLLPEQQATVQAWRAQRLAMRRLAGLVDADDAEELNGLRGSILARMVDAESPGDGSNLGRPNASGLDARMPQGNGPNGRGSHDSTSFDDDRVADVGVPLAGSAAMGPQRVQRSAANEHWWGSWRPGERVRPSLALAASIAIVAWCGGWFAHRMAGPDAASALLARNGTTADIAAASAASAASGVPGGPTVPAGADRAAWVPVFVRDAASAYTTFTPEVRHPVEVAADEQAHLVQWLSRRLGRPLRVPDLAAQGYRLLGGRLLSAADGMGAMFMYQEPGGDRLSLYVTVLADPAGGDTAFRYVDRPEAPTFYWVDRDFGYAVSAKLPRERIAAIAQTVYAQTVEAVVPPR